MTNKIPCISRIYANTRASTNTTNKGLSFLFTALPFAFIITEFIHSIMDINSHDEGFDAEIRKDFHLARGILATFTSLMFAWLMLGGIYVRSMLSEKQKKLEGNTPNWWIAQGFEGCGQFLILAIFQYAYYADYKYVDGTDSIFGSIWLWMVTFAGLGLILWLYLNRNIESKNRLPSDRYLSWYKIYTIILFSLWLGFNPTAVEYEVATIIIILITGLLRLYIINATKPPRNIIKVDVLPPTNLTCNLLTIRSLVYLSIPALIFLASFYNHSDGNTKLTMKYIYAVSLGIIMGFYTILILNVIGDCYVNPMYEKYDDLGTNGFKSGQSNV